MCKLIIIIITLALGVSGNLVFCNDMDANNSIDEQDTGITNREITVTITVPDTAWRVAIDEIYSVNSELWVISILERAPLMAAQVISTISDTVHVSAPMFPVRHHIIGKTWNWKGEDKTIFIESMSELRDALSTAKKIFDRDMAK